MPAVECTDLVVRYGAATAVDGVSLQAEAGEVVAVLGPNGAGKTSTVETLEGYRAPSGGSARVLGLDPRRDHRALVARIGVMLQRGGAYPMLGPRRLVDLFAGYYADPEPTDALLDLVGLRRVDRTPWRHLSGGEQQRLGLALALIGRPEVAFLDEPTAGVDPEGRVAIRAVVEQLAGRGVCVLLTTHELVEAERVADRIVVLDHGRVLASGTPAELAAGIAPGIWFTSVSGLDAIALATRLEAAVVEEPSGTYRVAAEANPRLTVELAAWLAEHDAPLLEMRTGATLEETYLALVSSAPEAPDEAPTARRRRRQQR
jgi:ABC-2 type transport system ATP-binding protein